MNATRLACIATSLLLITAPDLSGYADKSTHAKLTERTFQLLPPNFSELHAYACQVAYGAVHEDAEPRYLYHFWNPVTGRGLPRNSYTMLFSLVMGLAETGRPGPGLEPSPSYRTAMDWAWDEMPDDFDWLGSIDAYGSGDREKAYRGLGHVLHLLQDLGQPDHADSRPHPGNYVANYVPSITKVGYEGLWGQPNITWPPGGLPERKPSLQGFFRAIADLSRQEERPVRSAFRDEMALGLGTVSHQRVSRAVVALGEAAGFDDNNWKKFELKAAIVPLIPLQQSDARFQAHMKLGMALLPRIEQFGTGLMMHFNDIVNPPPFIEGVEITQNDARKYLKGWDGERGHERVFRSSADSPLERDVPAMLTIRVGPRHPKPRIGASTAEAAGAPCPTPNQAEQVRDRLRTITVTIRTASGTKTVPVQEGGEPLTPDGGVWTGTFTPTEAGKLEIEASDADDHFPQRQPLGDVLDSNPGTRARATGADRFAWAGYEPGADKNHAFTVIAPAGCHFDAEKNRFGTWTGTYQLDSFNKGFGLQIGGKVWAENTLTEKASVRFRSRITASGECHELTRMQFGPGSGSYTRTATTKGKESTVNIRPGSSDRVTTTETPIDKTKTTSGKSFVQGNADLLTGTYSVTLAGEGADGAHAPGFNDSGTITGCQIPTLSGGGSQQSGAPADEFYSRRQWSYSFRYEGPVTPPHAQLCPTCRPFGQTYMAITTYANQAIHLLSEATTVLSQSMRFNEMTTVSNIMSDFGELTNEFDSQLESELAGACERASILWVDESSEYGAAVAEVQAKTQQLDAQQREIATKALQLTQRAAAAVERSVPNAAVSLRKLGQILGTRGWAAFGG
jgi:hypothetical protein